MAYLNFGQLVTLAALARVWPEANPLFRRQISVAVVAFLLPWLAHLLYLSGHSPWGRLDLVPFLLPIAVLIYTCSMFHDNLADLGPIARNVLVETIPTGVLVTDARMHVVDANPAARRQLRLAPDAPLARPLAEIVRDVPDLATLSACRDEAHAEVRLGAHSPAYYLASWQPLHPRGRRLSGYLLTLTDITERKRHERQRRRWSPSARGNGTAPPPP